MGEKLGKKARVEKGLWTAAATAEVANRWKQEKAGKSLIARGG
jgi:hypothetical protein